MTNDPDLRSRFADVTYPAASTVNPEFGRLDVLAGWLAATGLSNGEGRETDRRLILFRQDQFQGNSVEESIELGIKIADQAIDSGIRLLFITSDRVENNHDLEILVGALTRSDAASVASRQSVSDQTWMENVVHIRDEIFALRDLIADPPALLAHTQSMDVAAMLGVICQSANRTTPLVIIGDAAHCAAMIAARISHPTREWLIPAVDLTSQVGRVAQLHLDRRPILELGMTFDRDYQSPIAMATPIIDAVIALLTI